MDYNKHKEIQRFNFDNRDKTKKCPDCGGELQPQWYGYSCIDCGILLNPELKYATREDLF